MACNFRISVKKNSDNLHLKLTGDFDGSSALQLIENLKKNSHNVSRVFIHTNCLRNIHPFGRHIFQRNFNDLDRKTLSVVFTGENAAQLAPE